jgi:hypothetical protein
MTFSLLRYDFLILGIPQISNEPRCFGIFLVKKDMVVPIFEDTMSKLCQSLMEPAKYSVVQQLTDRPISSPGREEKPCLLFKSFLR